MFFLFPPLHGAQRPPLSRIPRLLPTPPDLSPSALGLSEPQPFPRCQGQEAASGLGRFPSSHTAAPTLPLRGLPTVGAPAWPQPAPHSTVSCVLAGSLLFFLPSDQREA